MAGNPFRRARGYQQAGEAEYGTPRDETPPPSKSLTKKKKQVKIQTPPHSPEEVSRRLSEGRVSPPPPQQSRDDEGESSDSTATADSELDHAALNTRRNSGSLPPGPTQGTSATGAPSNPFARTLATNDASFGLQHAQEVDNEHTRSNMESAGRSVGTRSALDVDAFKNILMNGSAIAPPFATNSPRRPQDNSSSSNSTSSVSRHSFSGPYLEVDQETPRTSFDEIDSPSASEDDTEGSSLMNSNARLDDFAPPAPPKQPHGRSLESKAPQTVSFAEFDQAMARGISGVHTPPIASESSDILRIPVLRRAPSDLNKPLPPPPQEPIAIEQASSRTVETSLPESSYPVPAEAASDDLSLKKVAPPPPVSRRAGQTPIAPGGIRSTSNTTENSAHEEQLSTPDARTKAMAPAPPPSRKLRPLSPNTTPTGETRAGSPSRVTDTTETKSMPAPPPRRNASKTGGTFNRTPSNASHSSTSRHDSNLTSNTQIPPAPPPRRGASSKRHSIDDTNGASRRSSDDGYRRGSGTSFESGRGTASTGLQQVDETHEAGHVLSPANDTTPSNDILADMAAFEAELEALRVKAERGV